MADVEERLPFEDFPRESLSNGITRRQLLFALLTELHLFSAKDEGVVGERLPDLGTLADSELMDFIPAIIPGTRILIKDQAVWATKKGTDSPICLFEVNPVSTYTFNLINGRNSIGEIARRLEDHFSIPGERAFRVARGMFLFCVKSGVCMPVNNPSTG